MPINFTNFAYLPSRDNQHLDVVKSLNEGYTAGAAPYDTYQRQRKEALANIIDSINAQYAAPTAQAKIASLGAQKQDYLAKALQAQVEAEMDPLRTQAYVNQAGSATNLNNTKAAWVPSQAAADIQAKLSSSKNNEALAALNIMKRSQPQEMKAGSQYTDANGVTHSVPTGKTTSAQQAMESMSVARDYLSNAAPISYIGTGAADELEKDRIAVSDPNAPQAVKSAAAERLINNAVGYQIINEVVAANLSSQNIKTTDSNVKHMRDSLLQGTTLASPPTLDNLPKPLQLEAKRRFNAIQQESTAKRNILYSNNFPVDAKGNSTIDLSSSVKHLLPAGYGMPAPIKLPTFNSKAEYEAYLGKLSPEQKAQVLSSMAGK